MMDLAMTQIDLYGLLGVEPTASMPEAEVKRLQEWYKQIEEEMETKTKIFRQNLEKLDTSASTFIQTQQARMSDAEFESSILANLRRAEERKRLIEELKAQELEEKT